MQYPKLYVKEIAIWNQNKNNHRILSTNSGDFYIKILDISFIDDPEIKYN